MSSSETVHLVIGSTGAGKSTYARSLAESLGAVRFAIDEWMDRLFLPDRPERAEPAWYMERIERASSLIWTTTEEIARLSVPVVLEIGLTQRASRNEFYERARQADVTVKLHVVDAPAELRWARVEERNLDKGATYSMHVNRAMFDFVESMWEPPDSDELAMFDAVLIDTSR